MIVWIDLETTGLDHNKDAILEVAVAVTTDDLELVGTYNSVVKTKKRDLKRMDNFVFNLHTNSGLLEEVASATKPLSVVESEIMTFLGRHGLTKGLVLGGNSVHFDRYFMLRLMPDLMKRFTHQNLDVTSIGHCVKRWHPEAYDLMKKQSGAVAHRALDDILSSVTQMRKYRYYSFRVVPNIGEEK
jgi:oligoribonuclease